MVNRIVAKYIDILKKKVFYKKIYKISSTIRQTNVYNKLLHNPDFEYFKDYVVSEKNIVMYKRFIRALKHYTNDYIPITGRDFLMIYHIIFFNSVDMNNNVYKSAKEFVDYFFNTKKFDRKYIYYISHLIKNFSNEYNIWKEQDRLETLHSLSINYWEYEFAFELQKENFDDEELESVTLDKNLKQQQTLNTIYNIRGGKDYFESFIPTFVDEKMNNLVKENLRKAYFNMVKEELLQETPELKSLNSFVDELKLKIRNLIPNREDIHKDLETWLDTEFLILQNFDSIIGALEYLFNIIMMLDCAENENETKEWFEEKIIMLKNNTEKEVFISIMIDCFHKAIDIIDGIELKLIELSKLPGFEEVIKFVPRK